MGPMGGGGSGSSAGSPTVFLPPNQAGAAGMYGDILGPLAGMSANGGAGTPAAWAYPQAQGLYPGAYTAGAQYLYGDIFGGQPTLYELNKNQAVEAAQNAYNSYQPIYGGVTGAVPGLISGAQGALSMLPQVASNAFNPLYGQMVNAAASNPLYAQAMGGAQQAAGYGAQGAQNMMTQADAIMQAGFDPQSALFNRSQQQLIDQSNAANAMSGLGSSPYGAGVTANALGNFDINWQNQQLQRQMQAASSSSPLYSGATNLAATSAGLPSNVYMNQIAQVLGALDQQNKAGALGSSAYTGLLGGAGSSLGQALGLGTSGAQGLSQLGMAPYAAGATIGNNAITGLGNTQNLLSGAVNLGNNQFALPQQVLSDLMQYMGLGQSASQINSQIGQAGFNQMAQGFGGALSGANMLFNPNTGMFGGSGGLFGGGAAADPIASAFSAAVGETPAASGGLLGGMLPAMALS